MLHEQVGYARGSSPVVRSACKEFAGMKNEKTQEVRLEVPKIDKANLRHTIDYYRKIAYHRKQVLEGVRLCAMRNCGFWYGIHADLVQENVRPVKPEEIEDRIRTIQKMEIDSG